MKAGVATDKGLEIRDIPQPKPKPNEVLVQVRATSLNRADLNAARGAGGHGAVGATIGLDWAGDVVEAGSEVKGFKPGDRVMCSGAGAYADVDTVLYPIHRGILAFTGFEVLPPFVVYGPNRITEGERKVHIARYGKSLAEIAK